MWPNPERRRCSCRTTTVAAAFLVTVLLMTVGQVQNLKCRTPEHWRRRGEFVDIAEQCSNSTSGDRPSGAGSSGSGQDDDYSSDGGRGGDGDRRQGGGNRRNVENGWRNDGGGGGRRNGDGRRQNNREFSVMRQDFGGGNSGDNDRGGYGGDRGGYGGDRGSNGGDRGGYGGDRGGYGGDRGGYGGDRESTPCYVQQPQQQYYSGNNGDRQRNHRQGSNSYYPSVDYDARQTTNSDNRQPTRRYRRDDDNTNNNNGNNKYNSRNNKAATATGSHKILVNNRFRNVTKNGGSQAKGSILDNMDACTIHCVFNQLEMLNSNSRPDKPSIVNIMTNQIKDVELKEFIQDSIDECFDTLELDSHNSKCEFSKNFAMCMESKAQRNCDDWDENAPANKNYSQDGNNQQDKRKGY